MLAATSFNSELTLPGIFDFTAGSLVGNVVEFAGGGPTPGNLAQTRLIQVDQPIEFRFKWQVSGIFATLLNTNSIWEIELFFEQYGPGEISLGTTGKTQVIHGTGTSGANTMSFPGSASTTISIPAGTLPVCVCDVVAVIRLLQPNGITPCFLAAFAEYGKIQFYKD